MGNGGEIKVLVDVTLLGQFTKLCLTKCPRIYMVGVISMAMAAQCKHFGQQSTSLTKC